METVTIVLIAATPLGYLIRRFAKSVRSEQPSCGCGGCDGCPAAADNLQSRSPRNEDHQ